MDRSSERRKPVCYLCGETIEKESSKDHVPPRQFYSAEIRNLHSPNLRTIPTHLSCNRAYQLDEEYFIHSIAPLVQKSYAGKSVLRALDEQVDLEAGLTMWQLLARIEPNLIGMNRLVGSFERA